MTPADTAGPPSVRPRLLAPAGDRDAALAALHYGADAVYLGLPRFSARADASNFDDAALSEIVAFAHARVPRAAVYVAFNTLVLERELPAAVDALGRLEELGADAVIVQDLGVARLARRRFPGLRLLASTQAAVHSPEGVRAMARLGFACVLPARELALDEIAALVRDGGGVEIETFVHGALCYSYSGLCLFSSHATGRSGNRGRCASCCREPFRDAAGRASFPFSMKDLALADRLDGLRAAGVSALKIEGRLKGALYVAAVTDYYRRRLDGTMGAAERREREDDLRTIFSRPWTTFLLDGPRPAEAVIDDRTLGHRGARIGEVGRVLRGRDGDRLVFRTARALERHDGIQVDVPGADRPYGFALDDLRAAAGGGPRIRVDAGAEVAVGLPPDHPPLPAGAPVYCSSSQAVKRRYDVPRPRPGEFRVRHPVAVAVRISADGMEVRGTASVPGLPPVEAAVRRPGPFGEARDPGGTAAAVRKAFERLGDTDWRAADFTVEDPERRFVPASVWNEARRALAAALDAAREDGRAARRAAALPAPPPAAPGDGVRWSLRLDAPSGDWADDADELVLPLDRVGPNLDARVRVALPLLLRGAAAAAARDRVRALLGRGGRRWEAGSLAGAEILREAAAAEGVAIADLDLTADAPLHTLNRAAADALADLGFRRGVTSPEDEGANLRERLVREAGRMIVLVFQFTPLFLSAVPPATGTADLFGRRGERYAVAEMDGAVALIAARPFSLAGRIAELRAAGARHFRCDLSRAAAARADPAALWRALRAGPTPPDGHEGNFERGLA